MTIRRVLLPLIGREDLEKITEAAFIVGRYHEAEVRAVFIQRVRSAIPFDNGVVFADPKTRQEMTDALRTEMDRNQTQARDLFQDASELYRSVECAFSADEDDTGRTLVHQARLSDLIVLPGSADDPSGHWLEARDAALFQSGRPALFVPRDGLAPDSFDRVIIAWKESVEAARAVAAAQPFLRKASEVHLIAVSESDDADSSLKDVEQYLQLHYSEVRSETVPHEFGEGVGEVLLNKAKEHRALLVMGAYSHWRWREQLFGGVTWFVLGEARAPVLMVH